MRMLSKWPWISRCGDYWQQAELRTDGACRIMMMMMITFYLLTPLYRMVAEILRVKHVSNDFVVHKGKRRRRERGGRGGDGPPLAQIPGSAPGYCRLQHGYSLSAVRSDSSRWT